MTNTTKKTKKSLAKRDQASPDSLSSLRTKLLEIRLAIKSHQEKNTNSHKSLRKQIAQLLTSAKGRSASGGN